MNLTLYYTQKRVKGENYNLHPLSDLSRLLLQQQMEVLSFCLNKEEKDYKLQTFTAPPHNFMVND